VNCTCGKFGLPLKKFRLNFSTLFDKFEMGTSSRTSGNKPQCVNKRHLQSGKGV